MLYMVAEIVSGAGSLAQTTAIAWTVISSGHGSGKLLFCVVSAGFLPNLFLGIWGGKVVDSWDSGRILLITSSVYGVSAAVFAAIFLVTSASPWFLVPLSLSMGLIGVVDTPARQRFIARTVGDTGLQSALGVFQAGYGIARIGGPLVAGLALSGMAPGWVFLANAVTFALPAAAVTIIGSRSPAPRGSGRIKPRPGAVRAAWRNPVMRSCLITTFAAGTFGMQYPITNPLIVHRLHLGSVVLGGLGAALAAGAIGGSLLAARLPYRGPAYGLICTSAMGLVMVMTGIAGRELVLMLLCALMGTTIVMTTTTVGATVQRVAPEDYRGRMIALNGLAFTGAFPLGSLLVGVVNDASGVAAATATTGLTCTAITIGAGVFWLTRR